MNSSGSNSLNNNIHNGLLPFPRRRGLRAYIACLSGAALGSLSAVAFGLGLGELDSTSFLGQPLNANIELISLEGDLDLNTLIVRQLTVEEAQKMGVEGFYAPYRIDFVVDTSGGTPRVRLTSQEPVREPYLSLMVELRWPKGVVYREYPLLLDPPPLVPVRAANPVSPKPAPVSGSRVQSQPVPQSAPAADVKPIQIGLEPLATDEGKYQVQSGDTLSKIAERWREGTSQSISDTMQWLYENNSHAFANNNINRLRAGAVLQLPDLAAFRESDGTAADAPRSLAPLPATGSGEGAAAEASEQAKRASSPAGDDYARAAATRGLLTLGTESRDDKTRELIDLLVRENETLKARMEKLESSEYLDTLKQLIVLQRQQISDLRQKLGVPDNDATQEMDALLSEIGVQQPEPVVSTAPAVVAPVDAAPATSVPPAQAEPVTPAAVAEMDPVVVQPTEPESKRNWLVWLMFGVAIALAALIFGMLAYYRRMVPAKYQTVPEAEGITPPVAPREQRAEPTMDTFKPTAFNPATEKSPKLDYEGELTPIYVHKKKEEENWLGEKVAPVEVDAAEFDATLREVQEAFEGLALDEDALKNLDASMSAVDTLMEVPPAEPVVPAPVEPIVEVKEKEVKIGSKKKKDQASRRPDEEVRMSIAEKMAQYNPDEYRQEIESLGLLQLDELAEIEESDEEDVETIVYRAMMFCEFKKFDKARSLIEMKMQTIHDARLSAALTQIDSLYNEAQKNSKKAI